MRIGVLCAALLAVFVLVASPAPAKKGRAQPNIVVIMTDDQDDIRSVHPDVMAKTFNLLQKRGVTFRNSFVNFSACCPSRSSFFTGMAAHNHGVIGNTPLTGGGYAGFVDQENETLSVWLQRAGYYTAFMGKYLNGYDLHETVTPANHIPPGWNDWQAMPHVAYYHPTFNENGTLKKYRDGYSTDILAQKAVSFIRSRGAAQPFFLFVSPKGPHDSSGGPAVPAARHVGALPELPYPHRENVNEADISDKPWPIRAIPAMDATAIELAKAKRQASRETLLSVDDLVGSVVEALTSTGLLQNTVIIFTSDNGLMYGEHRGVGKGVPYEESIRVPLIIRGPGFPANELRHQLVNNLDVTATILSLAKAENQRTHPLDGRSLRALAIDPTTPWRTALLVQGMDPDVLSRFFAVRTKSTMYAEYESSLGKEEEYYDMSVDPFQMENRAGDPAYARKVSMLRTLLATLKNCRGSSCWVTSRVEAVPRLDTSVTPRSVVYRGKTPSPYRNRRHYEAIEAANE